MATILRPNVPIQSTAGAVPIKNEKGKSSFNASLICIFYELTIKMFIDLKLRPYCNKYFLSSAKLCCLLKDSSNMNKCLISI